MTEKCIFIFEAENNMVLSRDVYTDDGHLVVPAKTVLDAATVQRIISYHIIEVYVEEPEPAEAVDASSSPNYFDKIRSGEDFKEFRKNYSGAITDVKGKLDAFLSHNDALDTDSLLDGAKSLLANGSTIHVFDMLHSMRNLDDSSYIHCVNVALISTVIGKWLDYSQEDVNILTLSGLLHDIGKLMIPDHVLNKPGKLTEGEYAVMKTHALMGYKRLQNENLDPRIKEACLLHHERYDGSGYPFGLSGDDIPYYARIVAIADVYDAMTATRAYRGSICPFRVVNMLEEDAFSKYDPKFIVPFLHNVVSSYLHNNVQLSDGRTGEVVLINQHALSRPVVQCQEDFVDLSIRRELEIVSIL